MQIERAVLVYQAGIANVFAVSNFDWDVVSPTGGRKRLLQSDFRTCEAYCRGLAAAGVAVRSAHANVAGDVALARWGTDLSEAVFRESMRPVKAN
jgi:hypothetical protein